MAAGIAHSVVGTVLRSLKAGSYSAVLTAVAGRKASLVDIGGCLHSAGRAGSSVVEVETRLAVAAVAG